MTLTLAKLWRYTPEELGEAVQGLTGRDARSVAATNNKTS